MSDNKCDSLDDYFSEFIGESIRVITATSHYRGECFRIDPDSNNVLLKNVVKKNEMGWIDVSTHMLVMASSIESIYIEKSFPFDSNESVLFAVEQGEVTHGFEKNFEDLIDQGELE
jgi:hypothetical protein